MEKRFHDTLEAIKVVDLEEKATEAKELNTRLEEG